MSNHFCGYIIIYIIRESKLRVYRSTLDLSNEALPEQTPKKFLDLVESAAAYMAKAAG